MKIVFLFGLALLYSAAQAQGHVYTLEQCYALARQNYPLIKKRELIAAAGNYSIDNAGKLYLPQFSLSGQATYQSQTIDFSKVIPIPGATLPVFSKDQYRVQAEIDESIYDGGAVKNQQEMIRANTASQQQNLAVMLYALNDRIDQLYFSILLIDQQIRQNNITKDNFQNAADKAKAAYDNGTALKSTVDEFLAEVASTESSTISMRSNRKAYAAVLGIFIGQPPGEELTLIMPVQVVTDPVIRRPELVLYDVNKKIYDVEDKKLKSEYLPKLNAFVQGAYGRPTLNFVDNAFGAWWIGGIRMMWNLGSLYTLKNSRNNIRINKASIDIDRETFIYNTQLSLGMQGQEVAKYMLLLQQDEQVIALRRSISGAARAQLDNGVITAHDYISKINEENLAQQAKILHAIQLITAQYQYKNTTGN